MSKNTWVPIGNVGVCLYNGKKAPKDVGVRSNNSRNRIFHNNIERVINKFKIIIRQIKVSLFRNQYQGLVK